LAIDLWIRASLVNIISIQSSDISIHTQYCRLCTEMLSAGDESQHFIAEKVVPIVSGAGPTLLPSRRQDRFRFQSVREWPGVCISLSVSVCLSQELAFHMEATWTYPTVCCNEIGLHVSTKVRVGLLPYGTLSYNSGLRKFRHGQSIVETCYQLSSTKMDAQSVINWTVDNACNGRPLVCHSDPPALSTARFRCAGLSAFRQLW